MSSLLLGPLLGLESDSDYTVCFLTELSVAAATVELDGVSYAAQKVQDLRTGSFWRAELPVPVPAADQWLQYSIYTDTARAKDQAGQQVWRFFVPSASSSPTVAYASCNGFSSAGLVTKTDAPYAQWEAMQRLHATKPFSLLVMGGDQVYADEIWTKVRELAKWAEKPRKKRIKQIPSQTMLKQIEVFYEKLYQLRWKTPEMSILLASIPSIMMWDDHDIFDGWGSLPADLNNCPVYEAIFTIAKRYFELFQIRSVANRSLLRPRSNHYAFCVSFRGQEFLGLDNRAERTRSQVMSSDQWTAVNSRLNQISTSGHLFVLSAIPVVYRDFSLAETIFDATPWEEQLTDDLKDHWRSKQHEGERARLIMRLLENVRTSRADCRTVILSGDVHIGCVGAIVDRRNSARRVIHQIVSSGIVHPAPSFTEWLGITTASSEETEYLNEDKSIEINLLKPFGSQKYIRSRNFAVLEEGTDKKLWANWICENGERPSFPLA